MMSQYYQNGQVSQTLTRLMPISYQVVTENTSKKCPNWLKFVPIYKHIMSKREYRDRVILRSATTISTRASVMISITQYRLRVKFICGDFYIFFMTFCTISRHFHDFMTYF